MSRLSVGGAAQQWPKVVLDANGDTWERYPVFATPQARPLHLVRFLSTLPTARPPLGDMLRQCSRIADAAPDDRKKVVEDSKVTHARKAVQQRTRCCVHSAD